MNEHETAFDHTPDYHVNEEMFGASNELNSDNGQLYRSDCDTSHRHFTAPGYRRVNDLISRIAEDAGHEVEMEFLWTIKPWMDRVIDHINAVFVDNRIDEVELENAAMHAFNTLIGNIRAGKIHSWSKFSMCFFRRVKNKCKFLLKKRDISPIISLDEVIPIQETNANLGDDFYMPEMLEEPTEVPRHETMQSSPANSDLGELQNQICKVLSTLTYREREVIKMHFGIPDGNNRTLEEVAEFFKVTRERVRQIEGKAMRKLKDPRRSKHLRIFAEDRPLERVKQQEAEEAQEKQKITNNRILLVIEPELVAQKQVILDVFKSMCTAVNAITTIICEKSEISEHLVSAICDTERTIFDDLIAALNGNVIARVRSALVRSAINQEGLEKFDNAILALAEIMDKFAEMGGKPVETLPKEKINCAKEHP